MKNYNNLINKIVLYNYYNKLIINYKRNLILKLINIYLYVNYYLLF